MAALFAGLGALFGGAGLVMAVTHKGPKPVPAVTRDEAAAQVAKSDELARRKGALADMTNGTTGYEAGSSSAGRLVVGN